MISLPDWLTGYDAENAKRAADADAYIQADNQRRIQEGYYNQEQARKIEESFHNQVAFGDTAQRDEIAKAFNEGLDDGRNNITGFVSGAFNSIGKTLGAVILGVPAWVWLVVALALFAWLGGFGWLTRKGRSALR